MSDGESHGQQWYAEAAAPRAVAGDNPTTPEQDPHPPKVSSSQEAPADGASPQQMPAPAKGHPPSRWRWLTNGPCQGDDHFLAGGLL